MRDACSRAFKRQPCACLAPVKRQLSTLDSARQQLFSRSFSRVRQPDATVSASLERSVQE